METEENDNRRRRPGFDASSPVRSFVEVVCGVLLRPTRFFARLRESHEEERSVGGALLFAVLCSVVGLFLASLVVPLDPLMPEDASNPLSGLFSRAQNGSAGAPAVLDLLVVEPLVAVLITYLLAAAQHLFVLVFVREQRGFRATFLIVTYQSAISLVVWVPVLSYLVTLYGAYVAAVGVR